MSFIDELKASQDRVRFLYLTTGTTVSVRNEAGSTRKMHVDDDTIVLWPHPNDALIHLTTTIVVKTSEVVAFELESMYEAPGKFKKAA